MAITDLARIRIAVSIVRDLAIEHLRAKEALLLLVKLKDELNGRMP